MFWTVYSNGLSTRWAGPVYSTKNRVNGNEAHLLDERLGFGPAGLLDDLSSKWDRPVYSTNYRMNWIVRTIYHIVIFNSTERRWGEMMRWFSLNDVTSRILTTSPLLKTISSYCAFTSANSARLCCIDVRCSF